MKKRCPWVPADNKLYQRYHDTEWGTPVHDDRTHFEFLILEGAQAGLSWETILKRREGYRRAFAKFDPAKVAAYNKEKISQLLEDKGIIRNKLKIASAITNAQHFLNIQREYGSFDTYIWSFVNNKIITHKIKPLDQYPTSIPESVQLSNDLKKRGFKFVGATIMYAHMQACGLVNDHAIDCFRKN